MPVFSGTNPLDLPDSATINDQPGLCVLVIGTAPDGDLGEVRYFNSAGSVLTAFGGNPVSRFSPSPTQTTLALPNDYVPDLAPLGAVTRIYDFSGENGEPQLFNYLSDLTISNTIPITLTFDPLGSDPSVQPASGGLFVEVETIFDSQARTSYAAGNGLLSSDLRLPLYSMLTEYPDSNYQFAGCRVGLTWLPSSVASAVIPIFGLAQAVTGFVTFEAMNFGDGTSQDRYLSCSVTYTPTSLTVDPGNSGLPARVMVYNYSDFGTWSDLLAQIVIDSQAGLCALTITDQPVVPSFLAASPISFFTGSESPVSYNVTYSSSNGTIPDLTTPSGWLTVLSNELPDFEDFGFVTLAGLTGKALSADPASTISLIQLLSGNDPLGAITSNPEITLLLPWDTSPGGSNPYNPSGDANTAFTLSIALGEYAKSIVLIWGTTSQESIPSILTASGSFETQVPGAYLFIGALLRESIKEVYGNPGRPVLATAKNSNFSGFQVRNASDPPSGITPTYLPTPTQLAQLQESGLPAITREIGNNWGVYGPVVQLDGSTLQTKTAVSAVSSIINQSLSSFLGQPNNDETQANIRSTLTSLSSDILSSDLPIIGMISEVSLSLVFSEALQISTFSQITVGGSMTLFSETETVTFQTQLSL